MEPPYLPIDCSYYDRLEAWSTLGENCSIIWSDQYRINYLIDSKIFDLVLRDGVEYLVAANDLYIRLDYLISVNNIPVPRGSCQV